MTKLKIVSWNVNGLRAAIKTGFLGWLEKIQADVILLQEVRAETTQIEELYHNPLGYKGFWHPAEKKGYSGVAVYVKENLTLDENFKIVTGLGDAEFDREGRFLGVIVGKTIFASAYFPNSQRGGVRIDYKIKFCETLLRTLNGYREQGYSVVLGGDFNIAHQEIDLANPKQNEKNAGFLPEERDWLTRFCKAGFCDTFRLFEKGGGFYTWWSNRPGVRERNIGWRLDYHFVSDDLKDKVSSSKIHSDTFGSDHCPVSLELEVR